MGPPADVVMGPPPPPPLPVTQQPPPTPLKETQESALDKYRKLKRKFFELEDVSSYLPSWSIELTNLSQKHKEAQHELRLSGERNVKLREERECV